MFKALGIAAAVAAIAFPTVAPAQERPPADAWWTQMGLTAEDVGLAVKPWTTRPTLAELGGKIDSATGLPLHVDHVLFAAARSMTSRCGYLGGEEEQICLREEAAERIAGGIPERGRAHGRHNFLTPSDLKWQDVVSLPKGAKAAVIEGPLNHAVPFMLRVKFPADYKIPAHWHPGVERLTVLSGTFNVGLGTKFDRNNTQALEAGSVIVMEPETPHFAWTKSETVVQVHGMGPWGVTYVNPKDDPRSH